MSLKKFLVTIRFILAHPTCGAPGILRHLHWQFKKRRQPFRPYAIEVTPHTSLKVDERWKENGVAVLAWSMQKYDHNNMSFILDVLKDEQQATAFFDVGANVGIYSLLASEAEQVVVHSFEPHPRTAEMLAANLEYNRRKNVIVHQMALSDEDGTISFQDVKGSAMNRVLEKATGNSIEVERTTLDRLVMSARVKPNLIKIDVEGHELATLRGMRNSLDECLLIFLEENHDAEPTLDALPAGFSGPYYLDFKERLISAEQCQPNEDALYVNDALFPGFCDRKGYRFEAITC